MWTVRRITSSPKGEMMARDETHATKRDAVTAISRAGEVTYIRCIGQLYLVHTK